MPLPQMIAFVIKRISKLSTIQDIIDKIMGLVED